jgi:GrpB-like predicted nucleotidyltransferase (UPF0157 family)
MMAVVLESHSPAWSTEFSRIKTELQAILKDLPVISIEHIGSTSVPGLVAKPILDVDIIVLPENLTSARSALTNAGYQDLGEMGVPGRVAFRQPVESRKREMRRNTYMLLEGCLSLRNHLDLKKTLLEDEALRTEYGDVKRRLVEGGVKDVDEYCRGKNEVIVRILEKAGWSEEELKEVRDANE